MLNQDDVIENEKVGALIRKLNDIDGDYLNSELEVILEKQPFIISLLLGYRSDFNENELEDIARVLFLIWEFFKDSNNCMSKQIHAQQFEKVQERNISMLRYLDGVNTDEEQSYVTRSDLSHLKSKALLTGVMFQFDHLQSLTKMGINEKGMLIIGMKSLIECFETE